MVASLKKIAQKTLLHSLPLALSLVTLGITLPVVAQERSTTVIQGVAMRTLSVTGRGVEYIPTTLTQVRLGVEVQGKTAAAAQQEAAKRSTAVVNLLKSRNVEKLETTSIQLNPVYDYSNNTQRLTGYTATHIVSFRIPTASAGEIVDQAVNSGATRIDSISFIASDSAISAAQQKALKEATQDAQKQADAVLSALNLTRKDIIGIQINNAATPQPTPIVMQKVAQSREMAGATPIEGGEQQVEAMVTLQIQY